MNEENEDPRDYEYDTRKEVEEDRQEAIRTGHRIDWSGCDE
jgi:hypothetical protein